MSHVTSQWANQYCLVDPAPTADEIMAAREALASAAARALTVVHRATKAAEPDLNGACAELAVGWSAPEPARQLRGLQSANATVDQACHVLAQAANDLKTAIGTARAAVGRAYADADGQIQAAQLLSYPTHRVRVPTGGWMNRIDPAQAARVDNERCAVVAALYFALAAAERSLVAVAQAALGRLTPDPWADLPAALRPAALPEAVRTDRVSRAHLHDDLRSPTGRRHEFALAINATLQRLALRGQTAQLLTYDPDRPTFQGGAAIAVGDVASASAVTVLTPGVNNSPFTMDQTTGLAIDLNSAVESSMGGAAGDSATVLWFDYDIPMSWPSDRTNLAGMDLAGYRLADTLIGSNAAIAMAAGVRLASFSRQLRSMMGNEARLVLVGHSYGSTVTSAAAGDLPKGAGVDAVVLLGSPGAGFASDRASDYSAVDPNHVFVVRFPDDPVTSPVLDGALDEIGMAPEGEEGQPFGPDPATREFGAQLVDVDSNHPTQGSFDFDQHALTNYLDGASLNAVAAVVAGQYSHVPIRQPN